jgi:hypothetical protein
LYGLPDAEQENFCIGKRVMSTMSGNASREVRGALRSCRAAFTWVGVFSGVINILMLTSSIYMLQVYDRVLASRSVSTLIGLSLIALAAFLLQAPWTACATGCCPALAPASMSCSQVVFTSLSQFCH